MSLKQAHFGRQNVAIEEEKSAYQGFFTILSYRLRHSLFAGGMSEPVARELLARGDAAAALLYDPKHDLIGLIEQFRVGALNSEYGPWCLEVVAGVFERYESAEQVIRREIAEEAGISDAQLLPITEYYSTPGGCDERIHLFCALCDLSEAGGIHGLDAENEDIRLATYAPSDVFDAMYASRVNNAATLIALQWLQAHRPQLLTK